jgi:hypothetical protein
VVAPIWRGVLDGVLALDEVALVLRVVHVTASSDSQSVNVMNSVRSPSSRRSIHAPRFPGASP